MVAYLVTFCHIFGHIFGRIFGRISVCGCRYAGLLGRVATRSEVQDVLDEMCAELRCSHVYASPPSLEPKLSDASTGIFPLYNMSDILLATHRVYSRCLTSYWPRTGYIPVV